jgi:hypothetical protein
LSTRIIGGGCKPPVEGRVTELYPRVKKVEEVNDNMIKEEVRIMDKRFMKDNKDHTQ